MKLNTGSIVMHRKRPPHPPSMEICMKSLSRQGRKSAPPLFIIAVQFYGGQAGRQAGALLGLPGEECPVKDLEGNGPFFQTRGWGG